jgi:hypothetical protein
MRESEDVYTGQVERDPNGVLWAVVYRGDGTRSEAAIRQERVQSLNQGKRRVTEMLLAEADAGRKSTGPIPRQMSAPEETRRPEVPIREFLHSTKLHPSS